VDLEVRLFGTCPPPSPGPSSIIELDAPDALGAALRLWGAPALGDSLAVCDGPGLEVDEAQPTAATAKMERVWRTPGE
jgi:hypothetical protein